MTFQASAKYLNQRVLTHDKIHRYSAEYLLTAVVIRKDGEAYRLQAELKDPQRNSVILVPLDSVDAITDKMISEGRY